MLFSFGANYKRANLFQKFLGTSDEARIKFLIGGDYDAIGTIEKEILFENCLKPDSFIVDIGCGGARLARQFISMPDIKYVGYDVVDEFINYAIKITNRPDWNFSLIDGCEIPLEDGVADFCVFFSLFTHINEKQIMSYLKSAARVLKRGGKVIFSFLDTDIIEHKKIAEPNLLTKLAQETVFPRNFSHTREQISSWAQKSGLVIKDIISPHRLGQSLAIFEKE